MKQLKKHRGITVFYSYASADKELRDELAKHLIQLKRDELISEWHDQEILAGTDRVEAIDQAIYSAQLILLLISPDFLASDYCYGVEMQRALARYAAGEAQVIPILLGPVDWESAPFASLQCLPRDARPITQWKNQDEAFAVIATEIRRALQDLLQFHVNEVHSSGEAIFPSPVGSLVSERIDFNGFGGTKVKPVSLRTGSYKFIGSHDGSGQFAVWVKDKQNKPYQKEAVIFTSGTVNDEEGAIYIKSDDSYILEILAHGKWELSIQKIFQ